MKKCFFVTALLSTLNCFAINYFVSPAGSNSNNGLSAATAFQTLQYAADVTAAGDTVFALTGMYTNPFYGDNVLNIYHSGNAANWIVFKNYPGNTPVIKLYKQWAGIQVQGADYIIIDGFTIIGNNDSVTLAYAQSQQNNLNNPATSGNGIGAAPEYGNNTNKSHHITIRNCKVSKCGGGGIYTTQSDYLTIENNTVSECAWYSPYGNSGISLYQNWNSDFSTAVKNHLTGNTCFRNEEFIPFFFAGSITDGNGIIIDDSRNTQNGSLLGEYVGKTYIANNLVFDNGGRGIHCYSSDKVTVVNNTCYQNCKSASVQDGEFTAYDADSISFINNIALPLPAIPPVDKSNTTTTNLVVDHNLWAANPGLANPYGTSTIAGSPDFILPSLNPLIANFRLRSSSAAINNGTHLFAPLTDKDGMPRLGSDSVDIGAYEFFTALAFTLIDFQGQTNKGENLLYWITENEMNSLFFEIQRSSDKSNFETIGTTLARNREGISQYEFNDVLPHEAENYYRLKQVAIDGKYVYSKIILLNSINVATDIIVYPNPASTKISIKLSGRATCPMTIFVYNLHGEKINLLSEPCENGNKVFDISRLPAGKYFLKIETAFNKFTNTTFLKQ